MKRGANERTHFLLHEQKKKTRCGLLSLFPSPRELAIGTSLIPRTKYSNVAVGNYHLCFNSVEVGLKEKQNGLLKRNGVIEMSKIFEF